MRKLAHIVIPVLELESSDLYVAQPITFETMCRAKKETGGQVQVELDTAHYVEDRSAVPLDFERMLDSDRSVIDFGTFQKDRPLFW